MTRAGLALALAAAGCAGINGRLPYVVVPTPPEVLAAPDPATRPAGYVQEIGESRVRFEMVGIPGNGAIKPFWLGKTEVTFDEYFLFIEIDDALTSAVEQAEGISQPSNPYEGPDHGWGFDRMPAIKVQRHAAFKYCTWLSWKTGRKYRLPTEAEWEYACRAGARTAYFFGDDPSPLGQYAWSADNSGGRTRPVGKLKPNPWGLHDMLGNVLEYCSDTIDAEPGLPWFEDGRPHGTARGGSWRDGPTALRCDARHPERLAWDSRNPNRPRPVWWYYDAPFVGLRVARSVE